MKSESGPLGARNLLQAGRFSSPGLICYLQDSAFWEVPRVPVYALFSHPSLWKAGCCLHPPCGIPISPDVPIASSLPLLCPCPLRCPHPAPDIPIAETSLPLFHFYSLYPAGPGIFGRRWWMAAHWGDDHHCCSPPVHLLPCNKCMLTAIRPCPALSQGPGKAATNWLKCGNPDWGN